MLFMASAENLLHSPYVSQNFSTSNSLPLAIAFLLSWIFKAGICVAPLTISTILMSFSYTCAFISAANKETDWVGMQLLKCATANIKTKKNILVSNITWTKDKIYYIWHHFRTYIL